MRLQQDGRAGAAAGARRGRQRPLPPGVRDCTLPVYPADRARPLQYPHVAQKVAKALAAKFAAPVDVVISTGMSSVVLGQEVARAKKCRAIFTERVNGAMTFRRDFKLERGEKAPRRRGRPERTGRSNGEVVALSQAYGARVAGVGAMVDRSSAPLCLGVPTREAQVSYPLAGRAARLLPAVRGRKRAALPRSRRELEAGGEGE